jgi:hypothetical protein
MLSPKVSTVEVGFEPSVCGREVSEKRGRRGWRETNGGYPCGDVRVSKSGEDERGRGDKPEMQRLVLRCAGKKEKGET